MRTILRAIATVSAVGAVALLVSTPVLSAPARPELDALRVQYPKAYASCRALARQRGFRAGDPSDLGGRRFVIECIQGRRR